MHGPKRIVFSLAAAAAATSAFAHHSISGAYDRSRPVTVEGRVTEFQFVNPHPILVIDVADDGITHAWRVEMDNRYELADIGMTADTLRPGDRVIAAGTASRTEPHRLYLRKLERPADGFRYEQLGSRPRINRP